MVTTKRMIKIITIFCCLSVVAGVIRYLPHASRPFYPTHWRFNDFNMIILTLESGHLPSSVDLVGISNLRTGGHDAWALFTFWPIVLAVLGFSEAGQHEIGLRFLIFGPFLAAAGLVIFARRMDLSRWQQFLIGISPLFVGQLYIHGSMHGAKALGIGGAFLIWTLISVILVETESNPKFWSGIAIVAGLCTLVWRHTAGLILLIGLITSIISTYIFPIQRQKHIRRIALVLFLIHLLHSVLIFSFYRNIFAAGLQSIIFRIGGTYTDRSTLVTPDSEVVITIADILALIDRVLIGLLLAAIGCLTLWYCYTHWRQGRELQARESAMLVFFGFQLSLLFSVVVFYLFKGGIGIAFRAAQYATIFAFPTATLLLSSVSPKRIRVSVVVLLLLLAVISPAAFLQSDTYDGSSGWMTHQEKAGIEGLQTIIPEEALIVGSYHTATPLAKTHDNVRGFSQGRFGSDLDDIIIGLYTNPSPQTTTIALQTLNSEYSNVEYVVVSERESEDVGVVGRNGKIATARPGYTAEIGDSSSMSCIYSNGEIKSYYYDKEEK